MTVREIEAKVLLSPVKQPDPYFGLKYSMNLYRGCQHRCVYCDSRSLCYGIEDFDGEVLVKANATSRPLVTVTLRRLMAPGSWKPCLRNWPLAMACRPQSGPTGLWKRRSSRYSDGFWSICSTR
jgi:hypothetical protein